MEQYQMKTKKFPAVRRRLLWILIAAVWLFVILKVLVGALFKENTSLVSAFSVSNPGEISATVEVTARVPETMADAKKMEQLLYNVAEEIRLEVNEAPAWEETETRRVCSYKKSAKAADTELRVIGVTEETAEGKEENYYVYTRITLKEAIRPVLSYKELLETVFHEKGCEEISTTIQLMGDYPGYLTLERRNDAAEKILEALGAEVVYEYRKEDLYTIYAYTASLENYITVEGNKINLHIAMSQDEEHYRTILYLASPVLPDTW